MRLELYVGFWCPKVCAYKEEIKYFRGVAIAIVRVDGVEASMNDVIDVSMLSVISIKQINKINE